MRGDGELCRKTLNLRRGSGLSLWKKDFEQGVGREG